MSKWHDITPDTGDPQDLPGNGGGYIVTVGDRTCEMAFDPYDNVNVADWYRNVIAWREMPRAYVPGKRKPKPARFEHTCEVSDGPDEQSIKITNPDGSNIVASLDDWHAMADTMWGKDASKHIGLTKCGTLLLVRVTVEMGETDG